MADASLIVALIGVAIIVFAAIGPRDLPPEPEVVVVVEHINYFSDLDLVAEAAFVFDVRSGKVLFESNAAKQLPLASVTKLLTAVLVIENLDQEATITINEASIATEGDSGLYLGEEWLIKDLLELTLISSSNDGAVALAQEVEFATSLNFIHSMNIKAKQIGMTNSYFLNESGLDVSEELSGAYGSAEDVSILISYVYRNHPELLNMTTKESIRKISQSSLEHHYINTNPYLEASPGIIGGKTGFTDLAGGNLATVFDASVGRPVAVVVLGSDKDERFLDTISLSEAAIRQLSQN